MRFVAIFTLGAFAATTVIAEPPSFTPLGDLSGGSFQSFAGGVSGDGIVVGGWSTSACVEASCNSEAFRWQGGSMTGLGFPPSNDPFPFSGIQAVSGNGSILAGSSSSDEGTNEPFRLESGVFMPLGRIPGYGQNAHLTTGISDNGGRIVGWGTNASGQLAQAWLWENGAMMGLGTLAPGALQWSSAANGISGDGTVVVGGSDGPNGSEAFRWSDGVMDGMGFLPSPFPGEDVIRSSYAADASFDGSVIVGGSSAYDLLTDQSQREAFRWSGGVMNGIGDLPGGEFASTARAVSANGSIVIGQATGQDGEVVFVWDVVHGMRDLRAMLTDDFGLELTGWTLRYAGGISADGTVIVGTGINPDGNFEAFRAVVPEPGTLGLCIVGAGLLMRRRRTRLARP